MTNVRICFENSEYLMRKLWEFVFKMSILLIENLRSKNLLSEMGGNGADTKSRDFLSTVKNEWCWYKIGAFVSEISSDFDGKSGNLLFEMSGNSADEKSGNLCLFDLVFKMEVPLPAQLSSSNNGILWN